MQIPFRLWMYNVKLETLLTMTMTKFLKFLANWLTTYESIQSFKNFIKNNIFLRLLIWNSYDLRI